MSEAIEIRNWTIPPVKGITPGGCEDLGWADFPCLSGNVKVYDRKAAAAGHCVLVQEGDIATSMIAEAHGFEGNYCPVSITTVSGSVYSLVGPPRPSFYQHCRSWGIDPKSDTAVAQLVSKFALFRAS